MSDWRDSYDSWKLRSPDDQWERDTGRSLVEEELAREDEETMDIFREEKGMQPISNAPTDREITIVVRELLDDHEDGRPFVHTRRAYCSWIDIQYRHALWLGAVPKGDFGLGCWGDSDIIGWLPKEGDEPVLRPGLHHETATAEEEIAF
jgi:hypothetical protein